MHIWRGKEDPYDHILREAHEFFLETGEHLTQYVVTPEHFLAMTRHRIATLAREQAPELTAEIDNITMMVPGGPIRVIRGP